MKYLTEAEVVSRTDVGAQWGRVLLRAPDISAAAKPGQFVQVKAWEGTAPLLRRPFSIAGTDSAGNILLLIKKVGTGTRIIAEISKGARINVSGPLGNTFRPDADEGKIYLVAGGVGIAPLRFFIQHYGMKNAVLFYGSRDSSELGILDDPILRDVETVLTTEDGSAGEKGLVTQQLEKYIEKEKPSAVLTCGPEPMMRAVAGIAAAAGAPCQVSMETYMGCGIGACMGCVVPVNGDSGKPYIHACLNGPVMDAQSVKWDALK